MYCCSAQLMLHGVPHIAEMTLMPLMCSLQVLNEACFLWSSFSCCEGLFQMRSDVQILRFKIWMTLRVRAHLFMTVVNHKKQR